MKNTIDLFAIGRNRRRNPRSARRVVLSTALVLAGFSCVSCCGSSLFAQCCGQVASPRQNYLVEYSSVAKPLRVNTFKKEYRTEYRDEVVTSYKTVWETEERRIPVARQVRETGVRRETYKVLKPQWIVEYRDESYEVTEYVPETSYREEKVTVSKPVVEIQDRQVVQTVRKPVQKTIIQEKRYVVQRPVTTLHTQTVDRGAYVDVVEEIPGGSYRRLAWQNGGTYVDPVTGATKRRLPGIYWTHMTGDSKFKVNKVYKPNLVTEQVPVTTYAPETVVEQVPVNVTTFEEERIVRHEPIEVQKMQHEEVVRQVPVETMKPVMKKVEKIVPVQVCKMVEEEVVREVPQVTYKTVWEEKVERVRVPRQIKEERVVRKPVLVPHWVSTATTIATTEPISRRLPIIYENPDETTARDASYDTTPPRPQPDRRASDPTGAVSSANETRTFEDGEGYRADKPETDRKSVVETEDELGFPEGSI